MINDSFRWFFSCFNLTAIFNSEKIMLLLVHIFVWFRNLDNSGGGSKILGNFEHVVLEKDGDQLDRTCEIWKKILHRVKEEINVRHTLEGRKAGWTPHILRRKGVLIHSSICLTTGPTPLPKRFLQLVRSNASSFKLEYPLLSLRSSSSFLRLLPLSKVRYWRKNIRRNRNDRKTRKKA